MAQQHVKLSTKGHFMKFYGIQDIDTLPSLQRLPSEERFAMKVVASVLPFRVNNYVVEELIDWDNIPADPLFQLTFPQRDMLLPHHFETLARAMRRGASPQMIKSLANTIRLQLNPHPAGQ